MLVSVNTYIQTTCFEKKNKQNAGAPILCNLQLHLVHLYLITSACLLIRI